MRANHEGYWTMKQVRVHQKRDPHDKIACLNQHPGYWTGYGVAVLISFILVRHAGEWSLPVVLPMGFASAAIIALGPVRAWAKDTENNNLLESLARYGLVSISGAMLNAQYLAFVSTVFVLYFLTPGLGSIEVVTAGFLVTASLALGILVPSRVTYKRITPTAGMFFTLMAAVVIAITLERFYFG